jgi:hypothetical protein
MPTYPDHEGFAYSFSHATIRVVDRIFTAVSNVTFDQSIDRAAVYGTDRRPLKLSAGQLGVGEGNISFSDLQEAMGFYDALGDNPSAQRFTSEVVFTNDAGLVNSFELGGCVVSGLGGDFAAGPDPIGLEVPFQYLEAKVNGRAFAT